MRGAGVPIVWGGQGRQVYGKDEKRTYALVRHNTARSVINSFPAQEYLIIFFLLKSSKLAKTFILKEHSGESPSTRPQTLIIMPATCFMYHS